MTKKKLKGMTLTGDLLILFNVDIFIQELFWGTSGNFRELRETSGSFRFFPDLFLRRCLHGQLCQLLFTDFFLIGQGLLDETLGLL